MYRLWHKLIWPWKSDDRRFLGLVEYDFTPRLLRHFYIFKNINSSFIWWTRDPLRIPDWLNIILTRISSYYTSKGKATYSNVEDWLIKAGKDLDRNFKFRLCYSGIHFRI